MTTVKELIQARAADGDRIALRFEDTVWSWAEYVHACTQRAGYLLAELDRAAPRHVGLLLDNVPEFVMWMGAAALTNDVLVGINPTRRGADPC